MNEYKTRQIQTLRKIWKTQPNDASNDNSGITVKNKKLQRQVDP